MGPWRAGAVSAVTLLSLCGDPGAERGCKTDPSIPMYQQETSEPKSSLLCIQWVYLQDDILTQTNDIYISLESDLFFITWNYFFKGLLVLET